MRDAADAGDDLSFARFYWREIDGALLVVDIHALAFTLLNGSAAALWLSLLDARHDCGTLAAQFAAIFGQDPSVVTADFEPILSDWVDQGWCTVSEDGRYSISSRTSVPPAPPYATMSRAAFDATVAGTLPEWALDMDFLGTSVSLRIHARPGLAGSDLSVRLATFLRGVAPAAVPSDTPIHCHITAQRVYLRLGDTCVQAADVSDAISRLVLWCFHLGYGTADFLGTFHAAAVGRAGGTILMPGRSGVGKSTLTAYLAANDWAYGGDDIIGLGRDEPGQGHVVLPFCSAISVKRGAEHLLRRFYPNLLDLPEIRYDLKTARFPVVPPARQMGVAATPRRIKAIVFPHYSEGCDTRLVQIGTRDALLALVGIGYRAGERMDAALLDGLFDCLDTTPKYRLAFSDLAEADAMLGELVCN